MCPAPRAQAVAYVPPHTGDEAQGGLLAAAVAGLLLWPLLHRPHDAILPLSLRRGEIYSTVESGFCWANSLSICSGKLPTLVCLHIFLNPIGVFLFKSVRNRGYVGRHCPTLVSSHQPPPSVVKGLRSILTLPSLTAFSSLFIRRAFVPDFHPSIPYHCIWA